MDTTTLTNPLTNNYDYLGYGAVGGYIGAYAIGKYETKNGIEGSVAINSFTDSYLLVSALAGVLANYIGIMAGTDPSSVWKGILLGVGGQWVYNKFLSETFDNMF